MSRRAPLAVLVSRPHERTHVTLEELAAECDVTLGLLHRLVRVGVLEPAARYPIAMRAPLVRRVRVVARLRDDLGVNLDGAALALELLDRIDALEAELARLRTR